MVTKSLLGGLAELKFPYKYNPRVCEIANDDIVIINEDIHALEWAINEKKKGRISKLIAGPNLVVAPEDKNKILMSDAIDLILVPSQWVKDFYLSFNFCDPKKIQVWAAGVDVPAIASQNKPIDCLVYRKKVDGNLFKTITSYLSANRVIFEVIVYGKYKQNDYFELLNKSKCMIYLQESESQGVALFEAWVRGVPTLVWNRGYFTINNRQWFDDKISAPYLTNDCGVFFKNASEFVQKLHCFVGNINTFNPRDYILKNFTNKISALNFTKMIDKL